MHYALSEYPVLQMDSSGFTRQVELVVVVVVVVVGGCVYGDDNAGDDYCLVVDVDGDDDVLAWHRENRWEGRLYTY